jgi:hypothetical protein
MSSPNKEGNLVWIDLEMTGLDTGQRPHHRDRHHRHRCPPQCAGRRPGVLPSTRRTSCSTPWTSGTRASMATPGWWDACTPQQNRRGRRRSTDHRVPQPLCRSAQVAHVRQLHLPGPPFPLPHHAQAGGLLPLSQSGREHGEGTGPALVPGPDG